jgi:hypothetical protein
MGDGDGANIGLPGATHMDKHGDIGVGGGHAVQQRRGGGVAGGLRQAGGGHQLPEQDRAAGCRHGGVQRLQLLQHRAQVQQPLLQHLQTFLTNKCLSGIRCLFDPLDPGWVKSQDPDPRGKTWIIFLSA